MYYMKSICLKWCVALAILVGCLLVVTTSPVSAQSLVPGRVGKVDGAARAPSDLFPSETVATQTAQFVPGELVIGYYGTPAAAANVLAGQRVQIVKTLDLRGLDGATGTAGVSGYLVHVTPGQEATMIAQLAQNPAVAFAIPNWLVHAADAAQVSPQAVSVSQETPFAVNDPLYADAKWYLQRINASRAWALSGDCSGSESSGYNPAGHGVRRAHDRSRRR